MNVTSLILLAVGSVSALALPSYNSIKGSVPGHFQAFASSGDGQIGCINAGGNFTQNKIWCAIFHARATANPEFQTIRSVSECSVNTGFLDCFSPTDIPGLFYSNGDMLAAQGSDTMFGIDQYPFDPYSTQGIPLRVGGAKIKLNITMKAVSG